MNIQEIKENIKQLNNEIQKKKEGLKDVFKDGLAVLLKKHSAANKEFKEIRVGINNHEFNDGDPTYFGFNYEYLTLIFEDALGNETEIDEYSSTKKHEEIIKEFVDFFASFDIDNFYEGIFGDKYESITFTLKNDKLQYE